MRDLGAKYRLYTLLRESPKLVCVPDAAFLLDAHGHRKVFYLEQDRDTTKSAERVAAQKCGGYAGLEEVNGHRQHGEDPVRPRAGTERAPPQGDGDPAQGHALQNVRRDEGPTRGPRLTVLEGDHPPAGACLRLLPQIESRLPLGIRPGVVLPMEGSPC